jgi:ketosteroid isomerase-like protein
MGEAGDVVRRGIGCFNEGDDDGVVELCAPDVVFTDVPEIPGSRTYRGYKGIREWLANIREISDDLRFQLWESEERGNAVAIETSAEMHGRASGAEVGWRFWTVWRVKNGLITYHHGWSEREDALADLKSDRRDST